MAVTIILPLLRCYLQICGNKGKIHTSIIHKQQEKKIRKKSNNHTKHLRCEWQAKRPHSLVPTTKPKLISAWLYDVKQHAHFTQRSARCVQRWQSCWDLNFFTHLFLSLCVYNTMKTERQKAASPSPVVHALNPAVPPLHCSWTPLNDRW